MSMTGEEIRAALSPMKDFARAVLDAAAIVDAAEAAEKRLKDAANGIAAVQAEITAINAKRDTYAQEDRRSQDELAAAIGKRDADKAALQDSLKTLRQDLATAKQDFADSKAAHDAMLADLQRQIAAAQETLDAITAKYKDFLNALPK